MDSFHCFDLIELHDLACLSLSLLRDVLSHVLVDGLLDCTCVLDVLDGVPVHVLVSYSDDVPSALRVNLC